MGTGAAAGVAQRTWAELAGKTRAGGVWGLTGLGAGAGGVEPGAGACAGAGAGGETGGEGAATLGGCGRAVFGPCVGGLGGAVFGPCVGVVGDDGAVVVGQILAPGLTGCVG